EMRALAERHDRAGRKVLAFNCAFDRAGMRFGDDPAAPLARMAAAMRHAQQTGWEIVLVCHKTMDREMEPHLDAAGVDYVTHDITDANPEEIMRFYAQVDLAVGLRGHAQMIPFGLRRPIVSVISHDKLGFFLEDIGHP